MDDEAALVGRTLGGEYRIVRYIAGGGMGAVYEAVQEPLGRRVALKVLRDELASDAVQRERFRREAEAAARLASPSVVQVTDFKANEGEPAFLVMELLEGRSLADVLGDEGPQPPDRVARVLFGVLEALVAAHAAGIVHRDLKPANVFLGRGDRVKVLDFGLAKLLDGGSRLTARGALIGTPAFMSPEQARAEAVDVRTDLYALGAIGYAALAGRTAVQADGASPAAFIKALLTETPTPLASLRPDADPELVRIVEQAMQKDPSRRFASAEDMRRALSRWMRRAGVADAVTSIADAPAPARPAGKTSVALALGVGAVLGAASGFAAGLAVDRAPATTRDGVRAVPAMPGLDLPSATLVAVGPAVPGDGSGPDALAPIADAPVLGAPALAPPEPPPGNALELPASAPGPTAPDRAPARTPPARAHGQPERAPVFSVSGLTDLAGLFGEPRLRAEAERALARARSCVVEPPPTAGMAPGIWQLRIDAAGSVVAIESAATAWPPGMRRCVTGALAGLDAGPPSGAGAVTVVVTFVGMVEVPRAR